MDNKSVWHYFRLVSMCNLMSAFFRDVRYRKCECVCVGLVMWERFDSCVGVLFICVLVFTVVLYSFVNVDLFLFVTSVRTNATD